MNEANHQRYEQQPNYTLRRALVLGGTAAGLAASIASCGGGERTEPTPGPDVKEQIEQALEQGLDGKLRVISEMPQDGATSVVLEQAAEKLRDQFDLDYVPGQQLATLESANTIEQLVREAGGDFVQPGDTFVTWHDEETGFFLSTTSRTN